MSATRASALAAAAALAALILSRPAAGSDPCQEAERLLREAQEAFAAKDFTRASGIAKKSKAKSLACSDLRERGKKGKGGPVEYVVRKAKDPETWVDGAAKVAVKAAKLSTPAGVAVTAGLEVAKSVPTAAAVGRVREGYRPMVDELGGLVEKCVDVSREECDALFDLNLAKIVSFETRSAADIDTAKRKFFGFLSAPDSWLVPKQRKKKPE